MKWKNLLGSILIGYGAASFLVTLLVMVNVAINSTILSILNPLQAIIASYIQANTGWALVHVAYVGWGICFMLLGWAVLIWAKKR